MDYSQLLMIAVLLVVLVGFVSSFKIVAEDERLAIFVLGRFASVKGPGLVLVLSGTQKAIRVRLGAVGTAVTANLARFDGIALPVKANGALATGKPVKVVGFRPTEFEVELLADSQTVHCPNCGHEF